MARWATNSGRGKKPRHITLVQNDKGEWLVQTPPTWNLSAYPPSEKFVFPSIRNDRSTPAGNPVLPPDAPK